MRTRFRMTALILGALAIAGLTPVATPRAQGTTQGQQLQDGIRLKDAKGDLANAAKLFAAASKGPDRSLAARALLYLALVYERQGNPEAERTLRALIRDYARDQPAIVAEARARLAALPSSPAPPPTPPPAGPLVHSAFWSHDFVPAGATSPDGRSILLINRQGDLEIGDLSTHIMRHVTRDRGLQAAELSPNGRDIASVRLTGTGSGVAELSVMRADGTGLRPLHHNESGDTLLGGWTPDGKNVLIVATRQDKSALMAFVDVASGGVRELATFPASPLIFSLSPDGRSVVYDLPPGKDAPQRDIFLLDVETGKSVVLVDGPANDVYPLWTPDGQRIVFASDRTDRLSLWLLAVSQGKPAGAPLPLRRDMGFSKPIGFAKNGALYFYKQTGLVDVHVAPIDLAANTAGQPTPMAPRSMGTNLFPGWSADSRYVAFTARHGDIPSQPGWVSIGVHDIRSGEEHEIKPVFRDQKSGAARGLTGAAFPRWSPDGRTLIVGGCGGLCRVDTATGDAELIVSNNPQRGLGRPEWAGDGSGIFFTTNNGLSSFDLATREEREVYRSPVVWPQIALSHDGRRMAFVELVDADGAKTKALRVLPVAGGEAVTILAAPSPQHGLELAGWSPDDRELLYVQYPPAATPRLPSELFRVSASGGPSRSIGLAMDTLRDARISPDGRYVAFTAGAATVEDWVMENFLPPLAPAKAGRTGAPGLMR